MSELIVKEVGVVEPKSTQEVEQELLDKHEQQLNGEGQDAATEQTNEGQVAETGQTTPEENSQTTQDEFEFDDEKVLSYIGKKYGKQVSSFDELLAEKTEQQLELPSDVEAFLKYKKDTGRGIEDFIKLNKDFDSMNPEELLREYFTATEEGLDAEDIQAMVDEFSYDEDLDDESTIKKAKLAKKKTIAKAKKYFEETKEKYRIPLESRQESSSPELNEEIEAYKQYKQEAEKYQAESNRKIEVFQKKTDEVFSEGFKGFEFDLDGQKVLFSPGDAAELKQVQSTPMNFIGKYLDSDGLMSDAAGYHKALSVAMNPDKFAKFFYEQGKAAAIEDDARKAKNIDMSIRQAPQAISKGGFQIKEVDSGSGRNLKIKSKNKN